MSASIARAFADENRFSKKAVKDGRILLFIKTAFQMPDSHQKIGFRGCILKYLQSKPIKGYFYIGDTMLIKLSKQEVRALKALCTTSLASGDLAKKLEISPGMATRTAQSLEKKALITVEKDAQSKILGLSLAQHAQALKRFYESRPNAKIEDWLSGPTIELLILISNEVPLPLSIIGEESTFSRPTLFRKLNQLKGAAAITSANDGYTISDALLRDFANAYASTVTTLLVREHSEASSTYGYSIRARKHVVRRLNGKEKSTFFTPTGLSVLIEQYGLDAIKTNIQDYYFNLDEKPRKISKEEAFIHALLLSALGRQAQDLTLLVVALDKIKFDRTTLYQLARAYPVEGELRGLLQSVDYHDKLRQYE